MGTLIPDENPEYFIQRGGSGVLPAGLVKISRFFFDTDRQRDRVAEFCESVLRESRVFRQPEYLLREDLIVP